MDYLTFDEFKEITGKSDEFKTSFDKFYPKAAAVEDNVTNHFYQFNDIQKDNVKFRVKQFKLALCSQIIYFDELGADSFEGINRMPQSFSAGRTSVSNGGKSSAADGKASKSLLADDVYIYLEGTGLLYRGVPSC